MVLKPVRKMGNYLENPDGFETIRKMENDLEKCGQFIRFFPLYAQKKSGRTKKFPGSNATLLPRFIHAKSG